MEPTLATGRKLPTGADDTLGINSNLEIGVGYDNQLHVYDSDKDRLAPQEEPFFNEMSAEEALEIADIAILRWTKLKERLSGQEK